MKILQLCKKFPYPLKDGEAIAVNYLSKSLCDVGAEITLLSMNTTKHYFEAKEIPASITQYKDIHLVDVDNRLKIKDAFLNLFSNQSYHISRYVTPEFEAKLIELLQKEDFDIVQLETLYLAPYVKTIREYSKAKIVMRSHNVEHEIWRRITDNATIGIKKWYLNLLTQRLEDFEYQHINEYDMLVAITERDLNFFKKIGCTIPTHVSPVGLDIKDYQHQHSLNQQVTSFCFIGSLDWMPNLEGLEWLLQNVWPKIVKENPQAVFHIAGRNAPEHLLNLKMSNVQVHGEVDSAIDFINQYDCMLVPLWSGSGMRVKILEAMALGKVVISTDIGLEGINAQHQIEVLRANTEENFIEQILDAKDKTYVENVGKKARNFIEDNFDSTNIAKRLQRFYNESLNNYVVNA